MNPALTDHPVEAALGDPDRVRLELEAISVTTMPNGVRVATEHMPHARSAALGVWVELGARDEEDAHVGIAHFFEHMAFKGTEERTAFETALLLDGVGGYMNAFTGHETTRFEMEVPVTAAPLALELMVDLVARPAIRSADVEAERTVILEELHGYLDQPDYLHARSLDEAQYGAHPLGREITGTADTLHNIGADQLRSFHGQGYGGANVVVAAAGAIDHQQVCDVVGAVLDARSGIAHPPRVAPPAFSPGVVAIERATEQVYVSQGFRSVEVTHPDLVALRVGMHVLGGGDASRLHREIREDRGLAYWISAGDFAYSDGGEVTVATAVAPAKFAEAQRIIHSCIEDCRVNGITEAEFERSRGASRGSLHMALQTPGSRMRRLGSELVIDKRIVPIAEDLAVLDALSLDQVNGMLTRVLGGPSITAALGPATALEQAEALPPLPPQAVS